MQGVGKIVHATQSPGAAPAQYSTYTGGGRGIARIVEYLNGVGPFVPPCEPGGCSISSVMPLLVSGLDLEPDAPGGGFVGCVLPAGVLAPVTGVLAPVAGVLAPVAGVLAPVTGVLAPVAGVLAPVAGVLAPVTGVLAPVAGVLAPVAGVLAPAVRLPWMSLPWLRVVAGRRRRWHPSMRRVLLLMQQCY